MFNFQISSMLGWFDGIARWFNNIALALMGWFYAVLYAIFIAIGFVCDALESVFRELAGIGNSSVTFGETASGDILTDFLRNSQIQTIFRNLMLVAIVLILVFTVFAIIKSEYAQDGKTSKSTIIRNGLKAIFIFFLVPGLTFGGIYISNQLLKTLDKATRYGEAETISSNVFLCAAYNANRALYEVDANGNKIYVDYEFYKKITDTNTNYYNLGVFGRNGTEDVYNEVNYALMHGLKAPSQTPMYGNETVTLPYGLEENPFTYFTKVGGIIENGGIKINTAFFSMYNPIVLLTYYQPANINWIILFAGIIMVFIMMCQIILGLIARIFNIAMLYVISPPILAMMPLDGGAAFGSWRKNMVGHILGAYGAVVGMNLALIFMQASQSLKFNIYLGIGPVGVTNTSWIVTQIMRLLFIIVALNFAKKLPGLLSGFIGATDAYEAGKGYTSDVLNTAKKGAGIAAIGAGVAFRGANKLLNGNTTKAQRAQHKEDNGVKNAFDKDGSLKEKYTEDARFKGKSPEQLAQMREAAEGRESQYKKAHGLTSRFSASGLIKAPMQGLADTAKYVAKNTLAQTAGGKWLGEVFGEKGVARQSFFASSGMRNKNNLAAGEKIRNDKNKDSNKIINEYEELEKGLTGKDGKLVDVQELKRTKNAAKALTQAEYDEIKTRYDNSTGGDKVRLQSDLVAKKKELDNIQKDIDKIEKYEKYNDKDSGEYKSLKGARSTVALNNNYYNELEKAGGDLNKLPKEMQEYADEVGKAVAKAMKEEKLKARFADNDNTINAKGSFENNSQNTEIISDNTTNESDQQKDLFTSENMLGSEFKELIREAFKNNTLIDEAKLGRAFKNANIQTSFKKDEMSKFVKIFNDQLTALRTLANTNKNGISDKDIESILKEILSEMQKSKK